ncbi:MAG: OmpA family protein [Alphaproteobacteria bacterium]|nr:OmpA family protein [Alphaproteobacteria bacterium]MCW5743153.1 OmpA family protein [Alphaproteobacteria bacterium]
MASIGGRHRGSAHAEYTWPGYVDALASLLMAFVFLLSFYAVGQMALSSAVSDRDSAIDKLNAQLAALGDVLNIERAKSADLDRRLSALGTQLRDTTTARDRLAGQLRDAEARIAGLLRERDDLGGRLAAAGRERDQLQVQLGGAIRERDQLQTSVEGFVRERDAAAAAASKARGEADELQRRLDAAGTAAVKSQGEIDELKRRLDAATTAAAKSRGEADELQRRLDAAGAAAAKSQLEIEEMQRLIAGMTTDREKLQRDLAVLLEERERLAGRLKDVEDRAKAQVLDDKKMADALKAEIERQKLELTRISAAMAAANDEKGRLWDDLSAEQKLTAEQKAAIVRLTAELNALKRELAKLGTLLDAADTKAREQQAQIVDLGTRLNRALASKVEELSRYRSEFFGRLREALAGRGDVTVVGDRFVFQSEVLFDPAQAALREDGERQLVDLAQRLRDIAQRIPPDVDWVLQVDGHTDAIPINTPQFRSNWELSTARAIAVVRVLEAAGLPPNRLVAAGHAEHKPLVAGTDPASRAKNRRIELKLTSR